jgi:hypothetical protein
MGGFALQRLLQSSSQVIGIETCSTVNPEHFAEVRALANRPPDMSKVTRSAVPSRP